MRFFKIKSYAKINLSLNVISKLSSKFHKIESLVSFARLHDVVYLRLINSNNHKVEFKGKFAKGICRKNTVIKLLQMLDKKKLLKQKNILKEEEFNNKVNKLREKYKSYQELKNTKNNDLKILGDKSGNQILKIINEILAEYSTKNKISLIMEKKNIVIGKTELDITKNILVLLNAKIKKVELN